MAEGAARLRPARRGDEAAPVGGKQTRAPPHAVILIEQPEPREIARAGPDLARQDIIAVLVMLGNGPRHAEPVAEGGGVERRPLYRTPFHHTRRAQPCGLGVAIPAFLLLWRRP